MHKDDYIDSTATVIYEESVTGSGGPGGKGGGGGNGATVAPDSLQSYASLSVIDLIGEGQIGGLVNGAQSIFLNNTPLQQPGGAYNFLNSVANANTTVSWSHREGTPNQSVIPGFSDIETLHDLSSVRLFYGIPQVFTITNVNTDRVSIVVSVSSLTYQNTTTGDVSGTTISYHFEVSKDGGAYIQLGSAITISGKTSSKYQRSVSFSLPKPAVTGWSIKVVRDTPDSSISNLVNPTFVDAYSEIIDTKVNYANSALISVSLDPAVFSSPPSRSYLVDGLLIRIPTNFNTTTKSYSGIWDGSFKLAVSGDPAWILFDLLTTRRYGLGRNISDSQVNTAQLYVISRYCCEPIPDGLGGSGVEPRFSINTVIQNQVDAYQLIANISSVFRGMSYWNGGMVAFRQDSPTSPVAIFNQANVIGGKFSYASSSRKDRHSVVNVTWNDPAANYNQAIEPVEDQDLIAQLGVKVLSVMAFGCSSRGQAHRAGRAILYTEKYETNLITWDVGLDGSMLLPGQVVLIHDAFKTGKRMGGRITASTLTSITTDSPVLVSSGAVTLFLQMPDGSFSQITVNETNGTFSTFTWATALSELPLNNAVFVFGDTVVPVQARVLAVTQVGTTAKQFTITASRYNPTKYAAIEAGVLLSQPITSLNLPYVTTLANLTANETTYFLAPGVIGSKLHISWTGMASQFKVTYRVGDGSSVNNWVVDTVTTPTYDILGLASGNIVDISISGLNLSGTWTTAILKTVTILGNQKPPGIPTGLATTAMSTSIDLRWVNPTDLDLDYVDIYMNTVSNSSTAIKIAISRGTTFSVTSYLGAALPPASTAYYFWLDAVNTAGIHSALSSAVSGVTLDQAGYMVNLLQGHIGIAALDTTLTTAINAIPSTTAMTSINTAINGLSAQYTVKIDANGYITGYGLATSTVNSVPTSAFEVRADKFYIAPATTTGTTDGGANYPFMVTTATQVINGTSFPPGVYIKSAFITQLSANQVDTRGLTVRDAAGNIILGSGTGIGSGGNGIDFSYVGGSTAPVANATRNVFRGNWATGTAYAIGDIVIDSTGYGWSCVAIHTSSVSLVTPTYPTTANTNWTLYAVKGVDAITAVLSNDTHVFPSASDGTVTDYTNSGTTIYVYDGTSLLTYDGVGTALGSWKIVATGTNITVGSLTASGGYLTVGTQSGVSSTVDSASIAYAISGTRVNGSTFIISAQQSFAKSKAAVSPYIVIVESTNGNEFRVGQGRSTLLIAHVFQGGIEVTNSLSATQFKWRRVSIVDPQPPSNDAAWNALYTTGYKQVSVSVDAVSSKATFFCDIFN